MLQYQLVYFFFGLPDIGGKVLSQRGKNGVLFFLFFRSAGNFPFLFIILLFTNSAVSIVQSFGRLLLYAKVGRTVRPACAP